MVKILIRILFLLTILPLHGLTLDQALQWTERKSTQAALYQAQLDSNLAGLLQDLSLSDGVFSLDAYRLLSVGITGERTSEVNLAYTRQTNLGGTFTGSLAHSLDWGSQIRSIPTIQLAWVQTLLGLEFKIDPYLLSSSHLSSQHQQILALNYNSNLSNLKLRVASQFFFILQKEREEKLNESMQALLKIKQEALRYYQQNGTKTLSEIWQAENELRLAERVALQTAADLDIAQTTLSNLMGLPGSSHALEPIEEVPAEYPPYREGTQLEILKARIFLDWASTLKTQINHLPTFQLSLSSSSLPKLDTSGESSPDLDWFNEKRRTLNVYVSAGIKWSANPENFWKSDPGKILLSKQVEGLLEVKTQEQLEWGNYLNRKNTWESLKKLLEGYEYQLARERTHWEEVQDLWKTGRITETEKLEADTNLIRSKNLVLDTRDQLQFLFLNESER